MLLDQLDPGTFLHSVRTATLCRSLGKVFMPSQDEILYRAGLLHDIGKTRIRQAVLLKAGKLDEGEFAEMQTHVIHSMDIIHQMNQNWSYEVAKIVGQHHMTPAQNGYPFKGEMTMSGKILAVADKFSAICEKRCYKEAHEINQVVDIMRMFRDTEQVDKTIIDFVLENANIFYDICKKI